MYCRFCGKEMAEDEKVCVYCGRDNQGAYATKKIYSHELTRLQAQKEEKNAGVAAALGFFFGWMLFLLPVITVGVLLLNRYPVQEFVKCFCHL